MRQSLALFLTDLGCQGLQRSKSLELPLLFWEIEYGVGFRILG